MLFLLWFHPFILSGVISPLISSSILGTYRPGEFICQCLIFLPFHTVQWVLQARILKWFAIPSSSGPLFVRTLHPCPSWAAPHGMAHSFSELDKAVVHVISLISFLWLWFSFCLPSGGYEKQACGSFLMGETDCGQTHSEFLLRGLIKWDTGSPWEHQPYLLHQPEQKKTEWRQCSRHSFITTSPDSS